MARICLLICKSYEKEIEAIAKEFRNVDIKTYNAKCNFPQIKGNFDKELLDIYQRVILIGGCTIDRENLPKNIELIKSTNCFYMFSPKSLVDSYIKDGAYNKPAGPLAIVPVKATGVTSGPGKLSITNSL